MGNHKEGIIFLITKLIIKTVLKLRGNYDLKIHNLFQYKKKQLKKLLLFFHYLFKLSSFNLSCFLYVLLL